MKIIRAMLVGALATSVVACGSDDDKEKAVTLELLSRYSTGVFDESAAEISAYDKDSARLFVVNGDEGVVDILDLSNPSATSYIASIDLSALGKGANSVAVHDGTLAVAIEADNKQDNGKVGFYKAADATLIHSVTVGALPDMLTFTPDGNKVLVANEGEPNDDYSVDPEGSISVIDISAGITSATVSTADFTDYVGDEDELNAAGVRIYGPGATAAQDLEPEYIAVSADSKTAWVSLQENNALAIVDIDDAEVTDVVSFGVKKHDVAGNELDASNKDDGINIKNWPVLGMYMPDSIASFEIDGKTYIATANEGDSRDYDGYSEEERVKDVTLNPIVFAPDEAELQKSENLGRLKISSASGVDDGGKYFRLYSYGARSFSIWDEEGSLVWDSGADFAEIISSQYPDNFNASNDDNEIDNRSDDKGIEPEAITIATLGEKTYAFIGLERFGGIMVYDVSNPTEPTFESFRLDRDFSKDPETELAEAGDLGPEGIIVIPAVDSPNGKDLLVVASEVSGTVTTYQINR